MQKPKRKHNKCKPILCIAIASMLMCCAVLFGTAFAWMTDSLTGRVARIEAETMSVDLVDESGSSVIGQTLAFSKVSTDETSTAATGDDAVSWEPDATYQLPAMKAVNTGSMDMVCTISVVNANTEEGDTDVLELIDFTITVDGVALTGNGFTLSSGVQSGAIVISGKLKESVIATNNTEKKCGSIVIKIDAQQIVQ